MQPFHIFCTNPWIMPAEPPVIRKIFEDHGNIVRYEKGSAISHGGKAGSVFLLKKGLVTFGYLDAQEVYRVLSLITPGRTVGDLDSLDQRPCGIIAECLKPSELYVLTHEEWLKNIRSNVEVMEAYALSANRKHQCSMEGMIANYTQPLEMRLRFLLLALIESHYPLKVDGWNPSPVPLSITDISHLVASSRPWVSRTMSHWMKEGLMKKDGRIRSYHGSLLSSLLDPTEKSVSDDGCRTC